MTLTQRLRDGKGEDICPQCGREVAPMSEHIRHRTKFGVKVKYHVHCHDALMAIKAAELAAKEPRP